MSAFAECRRELERLIVQNINSKMYLVSCTNTHHDVTDLVNYGMTKNTKT